MSVIAKRRSTIQAGLDWQPTEEQEQVKTLHLLPRKEI